MRALIIAAVTYIHRDDLEARLRETVTCAQVTEILGGPLEIGESPVPELGAPAALVLPPDPAHLVTKGQDDDGPFETAPKAPARPRPPKKPAKA